MIEELSAILREAISRERARLAVILFSGGTGVATAGTEPPVQGWFDYLLSWLPTIAVLMAILVSALTARKVYYEMQLAKIRLEKENAEIQ